MSSYSLAPDIYILYTYTYVKCIYAYTYIWGGGANCFFRSVIFLLFS